MLALLLATHAHAACAVQQVGTDTGAVVNVQALAEPVHCRTVTLTSEAPLTLTAWLWTPEARRRPLPADHLRALPGGGWELGAPELAVGGRLELQVGVTGGDLAVLLGPAEPIVPTVTRLDEVRTLELDARHPGWGFADPKRARTVVQRHYSFPPDGGAQILPIPSNATALDAPGLTPVPLGVVVPAGQATADVHFVLPGAAPQGDEERLPGTLTLRGPGVVWHPSVDPGATAAPVDDGGLAFDTPEGGRVRWRVERAGDAAVIPDPATFLAGLDWRFARASLPEPAVPMALRGRQDRTALFDALVAEVRTLVPGALPGAEPLHPRELNAAYRSGWATPIERGLILHRFLGQEHFRDAGWVLTGEDADPASLTGFDTLLVTATVDGQVVWVDPGCTVCARGEIGTRWLGKPALGVATMVPTAPGRLERALSLRDDHFHASFAATGAAALWLRERIADVEDAARPKRLATALGMPDAELVAATGFDTAGGPITLELDGRRPPHDPFPTERTPWAGGWGDGLTP